MALAVGGFAIAIAAASAALKGVADPGVQATPGGFVAAVAPTGFAWRDGVRAGQLVVDVAASDDETGWHIVTTDDTGTRFASTAKYVNTALSDSLPLALLALCAAAVAVLTTRTSRHLVLPAVWLTCVLAASPLTLEGGLLPSTAALGGAAAVPSLWLAGRFGGLLLRLAVAIGAAIALAFWAMARVSGAGGYEQLESYRASFALVGGAGLVASLLFGREFGGGIHMIRPDLAEIAWVAVLAALAVVLVTVLAAPPVAVALVVVAGALLLPAIRHRARPVENLLLADIRAQAASEAAEAERGRLAREIHDVPLQELIAAIRQLDIVPGAETVSDDLRAIAGHLRNVAIGLRPPVLDDLGLPAALKELAEDASTDVVAVGATVVDTTTFDRSDRPPADVELAMYRIASEAVNNALRHAGASAITIHADVSAGQVQLVVRDDGHGMADGPASRKGRHIGLSAMRRRAQGVDADIAIKSSAAGTEVRAEWRS